MNVTTSEYSHIILEAWLPENWNGRFLSTGNGGLSGCIFYNNMAYANSYGFAAVGANGGHNGDTGRPFLDAPEVVTDFSYRSVHSSVVVGKQITEQFYKSHINYSYYMGCSTGGRQGILDAALFPEDFDGVIAGSPTTDWNHLLDFNGWLSTKVSGSNLSSESFVTQKLWDTVNAEILRQCDDLDGVHDGIIEDPEACNPKLELLLCPANGSENSTCLNRAQYARVTKSLQPLFNMSGSLIWPRLQPGAQADAVPYVFTGQPFPYMSDWYKYVIYGNESWDATTFDERDIAYADTLDPSNISTWNVNLTSFAGRGGKLLTYHGLQDPILSSDNSARFYSNLASNHQLTPSQLDEFYRYFRISGMSHCDHGPGAWDIGQLDVRPAGISNAQNNVLEAIIAWVERDQAPEYIEGIKWTNDSSSNGEAFRRRHCKYPARNVYTGVSNGTTEDGWTCVF